jgi:hypothetical protein
VTAAVPAPSGVSVRRALLPLAMVASVLTAGEARGQEDDVLDAPAPPTLPALAHRELTYTFEYTAASIDPKNAGRAYAWFAHNEVELPLVPRTWYVGAAADSAAGSIPGVGSARLLGNPELWGRGLWSSVLGLSSGGGLGIVLPVPRDLDERDAEVLRTVRTVRPWDVAYFDDLTLTLRPFFDIRHVVGRFIIQLRQGLDVSFFLRELGTVRGTQLAARATFYVGYRVAKPVGVGLELWEVYQVTRPNLADDERASFTMSPSIRFILPNVQPALSALFPIATPLRGDVASYFGARLNVGFTWDVWSEKSKPSNGEPQASDPAGSFRLPGVEF